MHSNDKFQPEIVFAGVQMARLSDELVYGWFRAGEYLYIGFTSHGLGRVCKHNIINRAEPIQEGDEIHIWFSNDPLLLERQLNQKFSPKYSNRYDRNSDMTTERICPVCKTAFMPTRYWQQFCTPKCRGGNNSWNKNNPRQRQPKILEPV